jgi:hypothetical protein
LREIVIFNLFVILLKKDSIYHDIICKNVGRNSDIH